VNESRARTRRNGRLIRVVWGRVKRALPAVLLVCTLTGAFALWLDLSTALWVAFVVPLVVVLVLRTVRRAPGVLVVAGLVLGAVVVPIYALLGFDAAWAQLEPWDLTPVESLVLGAAIVAAAAWVYLQPWWIRAPIRNALVAAAALGLVLVALPPAVFWAIGQVHGDEESLAQPLTPISRLDVVVLRDGTEIASIDPATIHGWQIRTWVGQVVDDEVRWGEGGAPPRAAPKDTDRVLLLMVDGGPEQLDAADELPDVDRENGEISRWLHLTDAVTPPSTPTFAVLQTTDDARKQAWRRALRGNPPSGLPAARRGDAVSLQDVAGDRSITDLALRLAVRAPTADQDLALAAKHRPALFFDSAEKYAVPLNIDAVLRSGKLRLCNKGQGVMALCPEVHGSHDLHNGADHLAFDPEEVAKIRDESTIYVNVTRSGNDHAEAIYLDYWWYLPHNPTDAGQGALCGAGFVLAGVTCFDHQSDWEGVTVVLDAESATPTGVSYAQHDGVTRYTWPALRQLWRDGSRLPEPARRIDTSARPLVFIARGTHASYPTACRSEKCSIAGVPLPDRRHDGGTPWPRHESLCTSVCLEALPTRGGGRRRARWNAFAGRWGATNCVLGVVCSSSPPPRSPGFQDRYLEPWCAARTVSVVDGKPRPKGNGACPRRKLTTAELAGGERLLALGDSFSSGQGAGSYEHGSTGRGNTCFRSRDAWPQVLAETVGATPLASLACSGATIRGLTRDRADGEVERRTSQISRISSNPTIVTVTVGGNDVGFADVLSECVLGADCTTSYRAPSGGTLEDEIAAVGRRLPSVYRAIRGAAPGARVIVAGYPRILPEALPSQAGNCAAWRQITEAEVRFLNAATRSLNTAIERAARAAGVEFVDVSEAFDGRELRCTGPTYMNRLRLRTRLFPASFHPTAEGHARLAELIAAHIGAS
jgi:lysophospholipase L1-like esterase